MMPRVGTRLDVVDPGFVRTRAGIRTASATVLTWATMAAVTSMFGVVEPLRITLFGAGACFQGALLVRDPQRGDRVRTLGWATVVAAGAVVVTVYLSPAAAWAALALLITLMFSSFALRSWSPRAGNLAAIGALTTYSTGAGYITADRIGWFVIASTVGFAWLAVWQLVIMPDYPVRAAKRSVHAFGRLAADVVAGVEQALQPTRHGNAPNQADKALHRGLDRVRSCRTVIDNQFTGGVLPHGFGEHDLEQLRVTLYTAQRGLEQMVDQVSDPRRTKPFPDDLARSVTSNLAALAAALGQDPDRQPIDDVARDTHILRDQVHAQTRASQAADGAPLPAETWLAAVTTLDGAELVAQSISQAQAWPTRTLEPAANAGPERDDLTAQRAAPGSPSERRRLAPTMALALQAVVAAVAAGLIAKALGNEQSLVIAWTAYLIIAGSAGESTRRAWARLVATILGATGGVMIAASVPHHIVVVLAVVTVGVFFTIFSAPVSYPAMVFWMTITVLPLFASQGPYLDLIKDKAIAALIGGCVAAVVALTVAPVRLSRDFPPAVLQYLEALDNALESHQKGDSDRIAQTGSELGRAHTSLDSIVASAGAETSPLPQSGSSLSEQAIRIDAVHDAFLRLAPLLSDSSRRLLGWTDEQIKASIGELRVDVANAKAAAHGQPAGAAAIDEQPPRPITPLTDGARLELDDSLWRIENLHARLTELALILGGQPGSATRAH